MVVEFGVWWWVERRGWTEVAVESWVIRGVRLERWWLRKGTRGGGEDVEAANLLVFRLFGCLLFACFFFKFCIYLFPFFHSISPVSTDISLVRSIVISIPFASLKLQYLLLHLQFQIFQPACGSEPVLLKR